MKDYVADYQKVCEVSQLEENRGRRFLVDDVEVALFLVEGEIFAVSNICPHQKAAKIYDGFIEDKKIVCPLHGWAFSLKNGRRDNGSGGLDCFDVKIVEGNVFVKVFKKELNW